MTANKIEDKTYSIAPGIHMGILTPDLLETIAKVSRKHNVPIVKITSAQRLAFIGMKDEIKKEVWQELGFRLEPSAKLGVHYVQACPGKPWCKFGLLDSMPLGKKTEDAFLGKPMPAKTKIGISGCPHNCCESYLRDVGVFGKKSGWSFVFGGNGGRKPRIGDLIATKLTDNEVMDLTKRCLDYYAVNARKKERTARFIDRIGIDEFKKKVMCIKQY